MKTVRNITYYFLLVLCSLALLGCAKKADESKPIGEVKAEAEKMNNEQLRSMAMQYKEAITAKKGELEKIGVSKNLKKVQGHWTAIYSEMKNVKNGHKTTLEFKKLAYDEDVNEGLFTAQFLKTGRP